MSDLEGWGEAERLGQVGSHAGEGIVIQEDFLLNLASYVLHGARI